MKIEYKKNYSVTYTDIDQKTRLSLPTTLELVQNMATEYFDSFKNDNITLTNNYNAVWVYSKTKIHFWKLPKWRENLKLETYTTKIKPIRIELETAFSNNADELLFGVNQELCIMDLETRKPRKLNTINYPEDMETKGSVVNCSFQKLNERFEESDLVYKQKIYSQDIDFSKHTNNVIYARFIMNSLKNDFLDKIEITDFEIHYISESKENQILEIYKKEKNGEIEFLIKDEQEGKEIVRANLKYMKCGEKVDI